MASPWDVIIIGIGAMGSAAAWQLASRGHRVLGLEQFGLVHDRGSHHGHTRMTRTAYFEHPDYVPLLRAAHGLWRELERETRQSLLHMCGGIYLGRPDGELIAGSLRSAREFGLEHRTLSGAEMRRDHPQFHLPDDFVGVWEKDAGYLLVERCVSAACHAALHHGATLLPHSPVASWEQTGSGVRVRTVAGETHEAASLIITAGPWADRLIAPLAGRLSVTLQTVAWLSTVDDPSSSRRLEQMPVWAIDDPTWGFHYGFPMCSDHAGLKVARHVPGLPIAPDASRADRHAEVDAEVRRITDFAAARLPLAEGNVLQSSTCLYTNSPDQHFVIDSAPGCGRVHFAAGFSGHGFKFASVIGHILADLATAGRTEFPVEFLRLSRFERNAG